MSTTPDAVSVARTAIELCDGAGQPANPSYADRIALAQAYATLAVAEETARVADNLDALEQRVDRVNDAVREHTRFGR